MVPIRKRTAPAVFGAAVCCFCFGAEAARAQGLAAPQAFRGEPVGTRAGASTSLGTSGSASSALRGAEAAAGSMSRISRLLGTLVTEETGGGSAAPGLGSRRSLQRWLGDDLPFDLSAFHGYQTRSLSEFERLAARQAGIAATRRFGPATFYLGAGVEDLRIEVENPLLRRMWEDGAGLPDDLERVHRSGTEGVTPRFTVGMSVGMGALRGSADFSMSGNPSLNLGVGIPIH